MSRSLPRVSAVLAALAASVVLAACGDDNDNDEGAAASAAPAASSTTATAADLAGVKDYLLTHTRQLTSDAGAIKEDAEAYYALAESVDFDYRALLADHRDEVRKLVTSLQEGFIAANPAYEQMEGVVAGVPELADFDVQIDAGGDASDPENAVSFSITTPAGRTFKQPGNYNFLIETAVFGTEPKFAATGVTPDLDGDGKVEFGEAVPDADFLVAAARDFETAATDLDAAAKKWEPTLQDALTALVVMTPTMSEYFEAWKNSRFVAGDAAKESAFVAASRLQDIADILGGLVVIYDNVKPQVAGADAAQAEQTGKALQSLHDFAARLRDEEADGKKFTAGDADALGGDAQDQAEAIAGQITQAAGTLNITLES